MDTSVARQHTPYRRAGSSAYVYGQRVVRPGSGELGSRSGRIFVMDPFTMAAEIGAILQAAESIPSLERRRASRKERREAYLAYQHETYRLMAGINHLSFLAQVETSSWQTVGAAVIPMTGPFIELLLLEKPSKSYFLRTLQEMAKVIAEITEAASPGAWQVVASAHKSDNQLRDRLLVDIAAIRDITADFMAALAKVRLVGRPGPAAAADILLALLLELLRRIPPRINRPLYVRVWLKSGKANQNRTDAFNACLAALGKANIQFISAVRADRLSRQASWQVWRHETSHILSAKELLSDTDRNSGGALDSGPGAGSRSSLWRPGHIANEPGVHR
jgi:hypothetical protein